MSLCTCSYTVTICKDNMPIVKIINELCEQFSLDKNRN